MIFEEFFKKYVDEEIGHGLQWLRNNLDIQSDLKESYFKFIEKQLRAQFGFLGTPIIIKIRKKAIFGGLGALVLASFGVLTCKSPTISQIPRELPRLETTVAEAVPLKVNQLERKELTIQKQKETIKQFGLDKDDIENIFDILEKENNL